MIRDGFDLGRRLTQVIQSNNSEPGEGKYHRRWCIFTSAGDNNAIRGWFEGDTLNQWDLIIAYYGDNEQEFSELARLCTNTFRAKGGKFQNLKEFAAQNPSYFEQYSYIWVCDDDIQMAAAQINEAFTIAELCQFWIAQPAYLPEGKNSYTHAIHEGCKFDYKIVNYVETGAPIFRQDKLAEFLKVYDGSLTGYGIDYWYMNFFGANKLGFIRNLFRTNELGRFAVIDKVQVFNPHDEAKGGSEISRLQPTLLRRAAFIDAMNKYGLVEFPKRVFACRKIVSDRMGEVEVTTYDVARQLATSVGRRCARLKARASRVFMVFRFELMRAFGRGRGISFGAATNIQEQPPTLAERLGYEQGARLLIVHADDLAVAHSVNTAFIKGHRTGLINSGSVMVPCPWFPEVVAFTRKHPEADLGIHLTLTSERGPYRWGPTASRTKVPSLVDQQGYFRLYLTPNTPINAGEVEIELRAQIEQAYNAGLRPTHLDSHQYRLQMTGRGLFAIFVHLGQEYNLPVFVARDWFTQFPYLRRFLTTCDVVIDHTVTIGVETPAHEWPAYYRRAVESLQPGVTQFVIHPGLDDAELQALSADCPSWGAAWRQRDFDFFTSEEFRQLLVKHDVKLITWREIGNRLRQRRK